MTEAEWRVAERHDPTKTYIDPEITVPWWQNHAIYHGAALVCALWVLWVCVQIYPLIPEKPQGLPYNYFLTVGD